MWITKFRSVWIGLSLFYFPLYSELQQKQIPCSSCNRANLWTNVYVGIEGGLNWCVTGSVEGYEPTTNTGYCAGGLVGYQFPQGVAIEAEAVYRNTGVENVEFFGLLISADHPISSWAVMGNIVYELPYWCWKPFLGLGIGYGVEQAKSTIYQLPTDQEYHNLAYQGFIGFDYNVWSGLDLGIEYKFFHVQHSYIDNHSLMLDLKWYW